MDSTRRSIVVPLALACALLAAAPAAAEPVQVSREDALDGCISQLPVSDSTGTIVAWQSSCSLTGNNGDGSVEIYRRVIGSPVEQLTAGSACTSGRPSISADGKRIAFESTCNLLGTNSDGNTEIFVWNDGSLLQLTASASCDNLAPSISGNGNFVAFDSDCTVDGASNGGLGTEIFRIGIGSGVLKQLTTNTSGDCDSTSPSSNADGSLVAFDSDCDLTGENEDFAIQIFTVNASGVVKQKTFAPDGDCSALRPAIDGSGTTIGFHSNCDFTGGNASGRDEIFTLDANGLRQATTAANGSVCASGEVRMASSGAAVAFTSYCKLNNQNADGSLEVFHVGAGKGQGGVLALTNTSGCTSFAGGLNASGTRVTFDSDCDLLGTNADRGVEVFRETACVCGAPSSRRKPPVSSDALFVLKTAVGVSRCNLCECDTNNDGSISVSDALRTLRVAVGQTAVTLNCPAP